MLHALLANPLALFGLAIAFVVVVSVVVYWRDTVTR